MKDLKISIGSVKYTIANAKDSETATLNRLAGQYNEKVNKLKVSIGRMKISDRLLLFSTMLIAANKKLKIFNDFESGISKLLQEVALYTTNVDKTPPLLNLMESGEEQDLKRLDTQLVMGGVLMEDKMQGFTDDKAVIPIADGQNSEFVSELIKIIDETTAYIKRIAEGIDGV